MVNEGSSRYDAIKLGYLLEAYANEDNGYAKSELSNKIITGEELIEAIDYANITFEDTGSLEKRCEKLEKIFKTQRKAFLEEREDYQNLKIELERLVQGKEGPFIDKIKEIIKD